MWDYVAPSPTRLVEISSPPTHPITPQCEAAAASQGKRERGVSQSEIRAQSWRWRAMRNALMRPERPACGLKLNQPASQTRYRCGSWLWYFDGAGRSAHFQAPGAWLGASQIEPTPGICRGPGGPGRAGTGVLVLVWGGAGSLVAGYLYQEHAGFILHWQATGHPLVGPTCAEAQPRC
jgi:hypothetical protein